jgi:RNA ligase (TIGR02306 family)
MSEFKVTVEKLRSVEKHPNADRLEIARLESMEFQFIVPAHTYTAGDLVIYFPVDSLLPDKIVKVLGLEGKLGKNNRVKTIRLRGEISQGLVAPIQISDYDSGYSEKDSHLVPKEMIYTGADLTSILGVTKYEPPEELIRISSSGKTRLIALPPDQKIYDIESVQRFPELAQKLISVGYVITEKLEGSHFSYVRDERGDHICSRRMEIISQEDEPTPPVWVLMAKKYNLPEVMNQLERIIKDFGYNFRSIALHGEMVGPGIQGNIYKFSKHHVFFFDVILDGTRAIVWSMFTFLMDKVNLNRVPALTSPGYDTIDFVQYSNGKSLFGDSVLREGIVVRSAYSEIIDPEIGRIILKVRSPEYLAQSEL